MAHRKRRKDALSEMDATMPNLPPAREEAVHFEWPLDAEVPIDSPEGQASLFPKIAEALEGNIAAASDAVTLPNHYARYKIEPIRFLVENFGPSILVGKVVKYSMRYDAKNGMEDLKKARRCLDMLIRYVDGDPDWWQADR